MIDGNIKPRTRCTHMEDDVLGDERSAKKQRRAVTLGETGAGDQQLARVIAVDLHVRSVDARVPEYDADRRSLLKGCNPKRHPSVPVAAASIARPVGRVGRVLGSYDAVGRHRLPSGWIGNSRKRSSKTT